jgi:hypothetical protein
MKKIRTKPYRLYHIVEESGALPGRYYEFIVLRLPRRSDKGMALVAQSGTGRPFMTHTYHRLYSGSIRKFERVDVKDLPLYIHWGA